MKDYTFGEIEGRLFALQVVMNLVITGLAEESESHHAALTRTLDAIQGSLDSQARLADLPPNPEISVSPDQLRGYVELLTETHDHLTTTLGSV